MKTALVIGNCQARSVSVMLGQSPGLTMLEPIVLQIARDEEKEEHQARIKEADVVLTQMTDRNFRVAHVRSAEVSASHPNVLIWPNVFYGGQQPFLRYFTLLKGGRMFGPLEAMHDLRIFSKWAKERGVELPDLPDLRVEDSDYVSRLQDVSIKELQRREAACDIKVSDYVVENQDTERLFLTFNHPTRQVLAVLANRMAAALGIEKLPAEIETGHEPLGRYIGPSHWPKAAAADGPTGYQGDQYELAENGVVNRVHSRPKPYTAEELEAAFYEVYDHNPDFRDMSAIRMTPNY